MIEFTLKVKVLAENDVDDIQALLDRMLADGRMALATESFELDVTDVPAARQPGWAPPSGTLKSRPRRAKCSREVSPIHAMIAAGPGPRCR
jgi:hypothetical protein